MSPHVIEITGRCTAPEVFQALATKRHCVFLDSARNTPGLARYSYIAADPFEVIEGNREDQLEQLQTRLQQFSIQTVPNLPPLQGGAIGYLAYDLVSHLEAIPTAPFDEFQLPRMCMGLYDTVVAFDHVQSRAWIVSQGVSAGSSIVGNINARERAEQTLAWIHLGPQQRAPVGDSLPPLEDLAPQYDTAHPGVTSNFTASQFQHAVQRAIDYIHAGDIFQVNLAQRLLCKATLSPIDLYLGLRASNPAPFAGYFDAGQHQIVSASPERFLSVHDGMVETRPIKGTRPRTARPEADLFSAAELAASGKDLAENVMIVDLMRNDLSRVCDDDSVCVTQLCHLEAYEHVQHLVSVVQGQLRPGIDNVELVKSAFPGGSITGAPKIRAMEIVAELEPTARGAYCGSLGYLGFNGSMDLNILIRTITASHGWWQFPVGGGIVSQSDPAAELRETWTKAEGMLQAIFNASRPSP